MVAVVDAAARSPGFRVPWVSSFGLLGVASLGLVFQDSSRQWLIAVWGICAFATSFGVVATAVAYVGANTPDASFRWADAVCGLVLAILLWMTPYFSGLSAVASRERMESLPAEQANAAILWCQVRHLGFDYESDVQDCSNKLIDTPYRNFRRLAPLVADPRARGELYRQVEAYLATPAMGERDARVKADVQRKLDDFRHDEAEAESQRALIASLPPALYRDHNGCVRSLERADPTGPCVRVPANAHLGARR